MTCKCKECGADMHCVGREKVFENRGYGWKGYYMRTHRHPVIGGIYTGVNIARGLVNLVAEKKTWKCSKCGREVEETGIK